MKNGLRLVSAYVKGTAFVDLSIAVRAGSRYEAPLQGGMSHLLEHMIYRGSKQFPSSHFLNHALETIGDALEGGTTREFTIYSIQFLPENLDRVLQILGDLFREPLLEDVETEKGIVFEEMLEELDEKGRESDLENIARKHLFGDHGLGCPVLGRKNTLSGVTREDLRAFFQEYYQPDNMVIAAAGNIDSGRFFKAVNAEFGVRDSQMPEELAFVESRQSFEIDQSFGAIDPVSLVPDRLPSGAQGPVIELRNKASSQTEVLMSFVAEGERSSDFFTQMALERVLDDGLSSRLQRSLCERKGLLYDIGVTLDGYTDIGVVDFAFKIVEERASVALEEIFRELKALKTELLDPQELSKVKARFHREVIGLFESSRHLAVRMAESQLLGLKIPLNEDEWKKRIEALTAEDIRSVARKIFVPERMVAVLEGEIPKADKEKLIGILKAGLQA